MFKNKEDMLEDAIISAGVTAAGVLAYHTFVIKPKMTVIDTIAAAQKELSDSVKNVLNQVQVTGNTVGALAASFNSLKTKLDSYGFSDDGSYGYTDATGTQVGATTVEPGTTTKREYKGEAIRSIRRGYVAAMERASNRAPIQAKNETVNVYKKQE